jgi:hypothetical protein
MKKGGSEESGPFFVRSDKKAVQKRYKSGRLALTGNDEVHRLVPGAGIEPAHPQGVRDFKSLASTYSATQAVINIGFLPHPQKWRQAQYLLLFP